MISRSILPLHAVKTTATNNENICTHPQDFLANLMLLIPHHHSAFALYLDTIIKTTISSHPVVFHMPLLRTGLSVESKNFGYICDKDLHSFPFWIGRCQFLEVGA
jgi:hypothetical protein